MNEIFNMARVEIVQFRWAGKWGPFEIKSDCEECNLVKAMIEDMLETKFKGKDVTFEVKPWLDNWWYCLKRLAYHAPILLINGKRVFQYQPWKKLPNPDEIAEYVREKIESN